MLGSLLIMAACGTAPLTLQLPVVATASPDATKPALRPLICDEVQVILPHFGKVKPDGHTPDLTQQDVLDALKSRDWFDQLHHLVGDTDDTIFRVNHNDAGIAAECNETIAPPMK
jgi:hypothetical protein